MSAIYVKMGIADLTQEILDRSKSKNIFSLRKTSDGLSIMMEFDSNDIPADLLLLGYTPLTQAEAQSEMAGGSWA